MAELLPKTENVASVLKVFAVLEAMVDEAEASLGDVANRAMTSKATAHRLVHTMMELGYVEQDPESEKYALTLKLFSLAARSLNGQSDILRIADRVMNRLSRATGEAINLGVMDEREHRVVYIHKYDSAYALSMKSTLGLRNPLHSTSLGKALLAWREDTEIKDRLAAMDLISTTPNTITDRDKIYQQLLGCRDLGYAEEVEESEEGVRCIAAPILNHLGKSVAAMSVAFPLFRFDEARKQEYVDLLLAAASEASHAMGYEGEISST